MIVFPWTLEEAEARNFRVAHRDGLTLISASHDKQSWTFDPREPYANDSDLVWRSAVLDADRQVVSLGFPKFANYGEFGFDGIDQRIARAVSDGTALLTAKEDGTLIVRSVYQGNVMWRTRNSFDLGPFEGPVMALARQNECLLDPAFCPQGHLLFEYVSPTNQIIIKYPDAQLLLLAIRRGHSLVSWDEMEGTAEEARLDYVRIMRMSSRNPADLQKEVTELEQAGLWDCEGLVVRTQDGLMSKLKGSEYLHAFRMRYFFKYGDFAALCLANAVSTIDEAQRVCVVNGVDWEAVVCAPEWFAIYTDRLACVEQDAAWAKSHTEEWRREHPHATRKDFAAYIMAEAPTVGARTLGFVAYDDNPVKWKRSYEGLRDKALFAPVSVEYRNQWFTLQEAA